MTREDVLLDDRVGRRLFTDPAPRGLLVGGDPARPGKAADFVHLRPPDGSVLASVLRRVESMEQALAAIFTLGGSESVQEVRVQGFLVYRASAS